MLFVVKIRYIPIALQIIEDQPSTSTIVEKVNEFLFIA